MSKKKKINHYKWLEKYLIPFFKEIGISVQVDWGWLITSHGDKADCYRWAWSKVGIPFHHGVAIYLLTYLQPWSEEVLDTKEGWVNPKDWVIKKYPEFKSALISVESIVTILHYHLQDDKIQENTGYVHGAIVLDSIDKVLKKVLKAGYNVQVIQHKTESGEKKYLVYICDGFFRTR